MEHASVFSLTGSVMSQAPPAHDGSREASDQGAWLHLEGDLDGARAAYVAALERDPRNATAHNNIGFLPSHSRATSTPPSGTTRARSRSIRTGAWRRRTRASHGRCRATPTRRSICSPGPLRRTRETCWLWTTWRSCLLRGGRLTEAEACWRRAVDLSPAEAAHYVALGTAVAGQQRLGRRPTSAARHRAGARFGRSVEQLGVVLLLREDPARPPMRSSERSRSMRTPSPRANISASSTRHAAIVRGRSPSLTDPRDRSRARRRPHRRRDPPHRGWSTGKRARPSGSRARAGRGEPAGPFLSRRDSRSDRPRRRR